MWMSEFADKKTADNEVHLYSICHLWRGPLNGSQSNKFDPDLAGKFAQKTTPEPAE